MGMAPNGILAYGYDLGGSETGWNLKGSSDKYRHNFSWFNPDVDEYWADKAEEILLARITGFTEKRRDEDDKPRSGYFDRKRQAQGKLKVELVTYGTYDFPGHILALKSLSFHARDYGAEVIKIVTDNQATQELDKALRALEIEPTQLDPEWILASLYG